MTISDSNFKVGLLVVLVVFLCIYFQKGRYNLVISPSTSAVIDTYTGKVYSFGGKILIDPVKDFKKK